MKNLSIIAVVTGLIAAAACGTEVKRTPGKVYMPDMAYSRAYETYSVTQEQRDELAKKGIHYSNLPVSGTISRGQLLPYHLKNDSAGYAQSALVKNPLPPLTDDQLKEAERLYLINCGICHGQNLDGNGPLWKDGAGPYTAAPKNFTTDEMKAMAPGTMFHSVTYGKNLMGSYASQLDPKQRWMIIHYIKTKQGVEGAGAVAKATSDSIPSK